MTDSPQWEEEFAAYLLSHGKSRETARTYIPNVRVFFRWAAAHETSPYQAPKQAVRRYINNELMTRSRATARNRLMALRAWFRFCIEDELRSDDPTEGLAIKKERRQPPRPFSERELQALLQAATTKRDKALLMFFISTGCRISEVLGIRTQDIDWIGGTVLIRGKGSKERWVAPCPEFFYLLRDLLEPGYQGEVWFTLSRDDFHRALKTEPRKLRREQARRHLCNLAAKAGVANFYPHRFRVTYAYYFLKKNRSLLLLKNIMGHEDIATTAYYAGYAQSEQAVQAMKEFSPMDLVAPRSAPSGAKTRRFSVVGSGAS